MFVALFFLYDMLWEKEKTVAFGICTKATVFNIIISGRGGDAP